MAQEVILTKKAKLQMRLFGLSDEKIHETMAKGVHQHFLGKYTASKEFGSYDITLFYKKDKEQSVVITIKKRINRMYKSKQGNKTIIFTNAALAKMKDAAVSERKVEDAIRGGKTEKKDGNTFSATRDMGTYMLNAFYKKDIDGRILVLSAHRYAKRR